MLADTSVYAGVTVTGSASLEAGGCVVHSNKHLTASTTSPIGLKAGKVTASGPASGRISPAAVTGAPLVADPFQGREFAYGSCAGVRISQKKYARGGTHAVPAAVHCGGIWVDDDTEVALGAGIHYFEGGDLSLSQTSRLTGTNVVLVFGPDSKLNVQGRSYVSLTGRESGPYAGMVVVSTPTNAEIFEIYSNSVDRLEGVIYLPNSALYVKGLVAGGKIAEHSDWTVTVTKALYVDGHANLVIKTDYAASTVPLPADVGNTGGPVQLIR
jgi:hypothetical protein